MSGDSQAWVEALLAVALIIFPLWRGLVFWRRWWCDRYQKRTGPSGNDCR